MKNLSYLLQRCTAKVSQYIYNTLQMPTKVVVICIYDLAWDELRRYYGQPYIITQSCQEKLFSCPKIDRDVAHRLNMLEFLVKKDLLFLG